MIWRVLYYDDDVYVIICVCMYLLAKIKIYKNLISHNFKF